MFSFPFLRLHLLFLFAHSLVLACCLSAIHMLCYVPREWTYSWIIDIPLALLKPKLAQSQEYVKLQNPLVLSALSGRWSPPPKVQAKGLNNGCAILTIE